MAAALGFVLTLFLNRIRSKDQLSPDAMTPSALERFVSSTYAPLLTRPSIKIGILVVFTAFVGLCGYGHTQVLLGLDQKEMIPQGSQSVCVGHQGASGDHRIRVSAGRVACFVLHYRAPRA